MAQEYLFDTHIIDGYTNNVKDLSNYPSDDGISPEQLKALLMAERIMR